MLAISGLIFMTFMKIHVLQFRLGDTDQFGPHFIKPPKFLINFQGIPTLDLFGTSALLWAMRLTSSRTQTSERCRHLGRDAGCVLTYR